MVAPAPLRRSRSRRCRRSMLGKMPTQKVGGGVSAAAGILLGLMSWSPAGAPLDAPVPTARSTSWLRVVQRQEGLVSAAARGGSKRQHLGQQQHLGACHRALRLDGCTHTPASLLWPLRRLLKVMRQGCMLDMSVGMFWTQTPPSARRPRVVSCGLLPLPPLVPS